MTPLRIVSLKPLILVGKGPDIADIMVTPERARYALEHARSGLRDAWRKLDAVCEDPPEWMVEGYPEFWTHEARLDRWLARCRSVARWIAAVRKWEAKVAELDGICAAEDPDCCDHDWVYTGSAYGGDDESYHGEGRCYCCKCGADGDA